MSKPSTATTRGSARPPRRAGREYRRYRWMRRAFIIFTALYVLIVLERERVMGRGEIFPFASWSLFTLVPNDVEDYSLRIVEVNGEALVPPVFFEDSRAYFVSARDHAARAVIDRLGKSYRAGGHEEANRIRRKFEKLYFSEAADVKYELVARRYDPIDRWRTRDFSRLETVVSYQMEAQ